MKIPLCEIGVIGLGVMGRNLALNMIDKGFRVAGYDTDPEKVAATGTAGGRLFYGVTALDDLAGSLRLPRAVVVMVPAGEAVDAVLNDLVVSLSKGDVVLDCGNSHYRDTDVRSRSLQKHGVLLMGVGVSGGEAGARLGPCIMAGGPEDAYERVRLIFEAIAARSGGRPCVAHLGPGSAGHYVKMVHNGIEYGMLEILAESYHLMKKGLGLGNEDLRQVFAGWSSSDLKGYLVEITALIFARKGEIGNESLVDLILDSAEGKGTGVWTIQDAMDLNIPVPSIDAAVAARAVSGLKEERIEASRSVVGPRAVFAEESEGFVTALHKAVAFAILVVYAQGVAQLRAASETYGYGLDLEEVARIWNGGCIIRSDLLGPVREALSNRPGIRNLLLDPAFAQLVMSSQTEMRHVVRTAVDRGIPVPGLSACLSYFDAYRSSWLPANLIQAQRDYFGSHGYRMIGREGYFHTQWDE